MPSTPAHAGLPRRRQAQPPTHPLLPPLTRGSLSCALTSEEREPSTPAHAGLPWRGCRCQGDSPFYPRSRGAPAFGQPVRPCLRLLPPLTRGSQKIPTETLEAYPSTPAHAGLPPTTGPCLTCPPFYPRSRGAPQGGRHPGIKLGLLPPLTRGSPHEGKPGCRMSSSTPAHAGLPLRRQPLRFSVTFYPRSRGAPKPGAKATGLFYLLPPLTRGSRGLSCVGRGRGPSTPAHAGLPEGLPCEAHHDSFYPRSRGAPPPLARVLRAARLLPPLTRGSRSASAACPICCPSTPAHAGLPVSGSTPAAVSPFYPRSRGAPSNT